MRRARAPAGHFLKLGDGVVMPTVALAVRVLRVRALLVSSQLDTLVVVVRHQRHVGREVAIADAAEESGGEAPDALLLAEAVDEDSPQAGREPSKEEQAPMGAPVARAEAEDDHHHRREEGRHQGHALELVDVAQQGRAPAHLQVLFTLIPLSSLGLLLFRLGRLAPQVSVPHLGPKHPIVEREHLACRLILVSSLDETQISLKTVLYYG